MTTLFVNYLTNRAAICAGVTQKPCVIFYVTAGLSRVNSLPMEQKHTPTPRLNRRHLVALIAGIVLVGASIATVMTGENTNEALPESSAAPMAPEAVATEQSMPLPSSETLAASYGGMSKNATQQALVTRVGKHVVEQSEAAKSINALRFVLLADENRINAFAMPDGTIFITTLLFNHMKTEGQLAAVLAHEAAQLAASQRPVYLNTGIVAFDREQETKADALGVKFMAQAGYDPNAFLTVLTALRDINNTTPVEFFQTHPSPVNRVAHIEYAITQQFPDGVPESLSD